MIGFQSPPRIPKREREPPITLHQHHGTSRYITSEVVETPTSDSHCSTRKAAKLEHRNNLRAVPGGGVEPPRYQVPADFGCDATLLQLLTLQQFLRLAFDGAARLVQFGVVSCRPVAHTLRTPKLATAARTILRRARCHTSEFNFQPRNQ